MQQTNLKWHRTRQRPRRCRSGARPQRVGGGTLTITNDDQNFGIKGIEHHLTTLKADIVSKEIKAIVKAHKGVFNLYDLIDELQPFIRTEFPDEPQPHGLARWFAKQFEHYKANAKNTNASPPPK